MAERKNEVTRITPASPEEAAAHFQARMHLETDCWDVHATQSLDPRGFVLLDVRSRELFDRGHLPGAHHLPHWKIDHDSLEALGETPLFVVYCAGPHCNGAQKAGHRIAECGRHVKEMIGGVQGWIDEGYQLESTAASRQQS